MKGISQRLSLAAVVLAAVSLAVCFAQFGHARAERERGASSKSLRGRAAHEYLTQSGLYDALSASSAFAEQSKLLADDGAAQDNFGFSVAVSGDTAVVGSPRDQVGGNPAQGSAYVYVRANGVWTQQQKLTASDGAASDEFGYAVAIDGDTVFVGRHNTQQFSNRTRGAVYVYTRSGSTWTQAPSILSSDGVEGDNFGVSLAVDGDTLVVGAQLKNNGTTFFQGAAYVFTGAGSTWTQQAKLLADDGGFANFFATSVAVSGNTVIVGSPGQPGTSADGGRGSAYVFARSGTAWSQQQKLLASDGAAGDAFGFSVGVSNDTAVVGARLDTVSGVGAQGSVYVFTRSGTTWSEQQHLFGVEQTQRNDQFGYAVAIDGDTIAVGSPLHEIEPGIANHGAVYVFARTGSAWARTQKLIHSDPNPDGLGQAVAFDRSSIIAGAPAKNSNRGAAYVFDGTSVSTPTPTPTPTATPTPTGTVKFDSATYGGDEGTAPTAGASFGEASQAAFAATGSVTLTVTRTDATQEASVDYDTQDGTASARTDYTAVSGTLRFAAGEISKTIVVPVTDDRFQESQETFSVVLSNPVGVNLGSPSSATVNVTSDDTSTGPSPVSDPSFDVDFFVRQHYADFLGREPDAAGLAFWKNEITQCETRPESERQACREVKRVNVSAAFFLSIEFQQTGFYVYLLHQAAFDSGEHLSLRQFNADVGEARKGVVVGQGNWEQQLQANKQALALLLVRRQAFTSVYPASLTPAQFVDALNANTGGSLSQAERDARVAELTADNTDAGRASVLLKMTDNAAFRAREFNRAFVLMQYFGYLRREPDDSPDSNFTGYNFWLAKLNQFNGNFVAAEMVKAFITSEEYKKRFGQ